MRIALLTSYLALEEDADSGIGQHYRILADALADAGHEVEVFYLCDTKSAPAARRGLATLRPRWTLHLLEPSLSRLLAAVPDHKWTVNQLFQHLLLAWKGARALRRAHMRRPFDVVETHAYNSPATFLLLQTPRPVVITRVSTTLGQMLRLGTLRSGLLRFEASLERHTTRSSDALVTHTPRHRDALCAEEGHDPACFAIIPHGIPSPSLPAATDPAHPPLDILFVGRFEARKGVDVLLDAIPLVARACPETTFTLAGSRDTPGLWEAFCSRHPALRESRVRAPGRASPGDLTRLYSRCAIFVGPSRYESFGLIYVEAMSHGKPVVACQTGGVPDVVGHGVTGLLVPPGNHEALAEAIIRLARQPDLRARMGEAGRQAFLDHFSAQALAANSASLYRQCRDFFAGKVV